MKSEQKIYAHLSTRIHPNTHCLLEIYEIPLSAVNHAVTSRSSPDIGIVMVDAGLQQFPRSFPSTSYANEWWKEKKKV